MSSQLKTVSSHIGSLRQKIRQTHDDTTFTDEQLYKTLVEARALVLERKLRQFNPVSQSTHQTLAMPLDDHIFATDFLPFGNEKVKKGRFRLPCVLTSRVTDAIRVFLPNGKEVSKSDSSSRLNNQYSKTLTDKPTYEVINDFLYIWNVGKLKAIMITGIFEDPTELSDIPKYNSDCELVAETCYDVYKDQFPLEAGLHDMMYTQAIQNVLRTLQIPEDKSNDSESTT